MASGHPQGDSPTAEALTSSRRVERLEHEGRVIAVSWADGYHGTFHSIWLRDNCPCSECAHPGTGQRLLDTISIPGDIAPSSVTPAEDGSVEIVWTHGGHISRYAPDWLRAHSYSGAGLGDRDAPLMLWGREIMHDLPEADYADVVSREETLRDWLAGVDRFGFAILHQVPIRPGEVTRVVDLFGYVRETNYGRLFDVRSVVNPNNLAFTGLPLGVHTDNPYRDPTPTLQLLHCLSTSASGGETILVDGFRVAEALRPSDSDKFDLLCRQAIPFRFQDEQTDLATEVPVITLGPGGGVAAIHFNNRSKAPLVLDEDLIEPYYEAYRRFAIMLADPEFEICFGLEAGDLLIMDNLRVLHGRTGFSAAGERHLQGCYADRDGLRSRLAVLNRQLIGMGAPSTEGRTTAPARPPASPAPGPR